MKRYVTCRYCGKPAKLIRERRKGVHLSQLIWFCPICNAECGAREHDHEPIGIMADEQLRHDHRKLHRMLWKAQGTARISEALNWLMDELHIAANGIQDFDEQTTVKAIQLMDTLGGKRPWKRSGRTS